jgi:peptidyl-tRNA hydrolase
MKAIVLHTAVADNGGTRREAGERLALGEGPAEIDPDRAEALVAAGSARDASPGQRPAKKAE